MNSVTTFVTLNQEFKPFYELLPQGASKAQIIKQLVEYADQKLEIESLLAWAKQHNPTRYEKHQPYYDPSNGDTTYPKMMRRLMISMTD